MKKIMIPAVIGVFCLIILAWAGGWHGTVYWSTGGGAGKEAYVFAKDAASPYPYTYTQSGSGYTLDETSGNGGMVEDDYYYSVHARKTRNDTVFRGFRNVGEYYEDENPLWGLDITIYPQSPEK